jgi:hypothetical protein
MTLKVGALVRVECNSGCFCTEQDNCGLSGKVGTLANINEHNTDGDFYGVSFPGQPHLVYFWTHELQAITLSTLTTMVDQGDGDDRELARLMADFEAVPSYVERYRSGMKAEL